MGQARDVFFTAGVAETKYINDIFVNNDPTGEDTGLIYDCGAIAISDVPGTSVLDNYCYWDQPNSCQWHPFGTYATADKSVPDGNSGPQDVYRYYELDHVRQIALSFDGSAAAGTTGSVKIYLQTEFGEGGRLLGTVNVYVVSGTPPNTWFTATSSSSNVSGDSLLLDHPFLNGNQSAKLFLTHAYYGNNHNHPIAATYDGSAGRWKIRNEDGALMPVGRSFHVRIDPSAKGIRTPQFGSYSYLAINDPVANGNPYATILVTANTKGTRRITHPIAVKYVAPYWYIVTSDGAALPSSNPFTGDIAGFFVRIIGASQYYDDYVIGDVSGFSDTDLSNGAGVDINGPYRISSNKKYLSGFCFTIQGMTPIIVTPVINPLPPPSPGNYSYTDPKYVGVYASGPTMYIYHEDGTSMPAQAAFNVWGPPHFACDPTY